MRISDWSPDVCSSDRGAGQKVVDRTGDEADGQRSAFTKRCQTGALGCSVGLVEQRLRLDEEGAAGGGECYRAGDRKSVAWGKSVSVRLDHGGRRIITKPTHSSQAP